MKYLKNISKIFVIIIIIIVILLGIFYLYDFLNNKNNNILDKFTIFQSYYTGEPSPTGDYTPQTNTKYELNGIQAIVSNNIGLYALTNNTIIKSYSLSTNKWITQSININNSQNKNALKYNSSTENTIICKSSDGLILSANLYALYMYNSFINNSNNVNCIYYISINTDGTISQNVNSNCLALPLITARNVPINTIANNSQLPLQPFDNIRLIAVNNTCLFVLGCYDASTSYNMQKYSPPSQNDTGLYYTILNNGIPISNTSSNWKSIALPNFIMRKDIKQIIVNDSYIFMHTSTMNSNSVYAIYYMPITINNNNIIQATNWIQMGGSNIINKPNGINFDSITVNNDVIWGIEQNGNTKKTNLWWCALNNKSPPPANDNTYGWKSIIINSISALDLVIYNNNFIIFGSQNSSNFVIPLLGNYTQSPKITSNIGTNGGFPTNGESETNEESETNGESETNEESGTNEDSGTNGESGTNGVSGTNGIMGASSVLGTNVTSANGITGTTSVSGTTDILDTNGIVDTNSKLNSDDNNMYNGSYTAYGNYDISDSLIKNIKATIDGNQYNLNDFMAKNNIIDSNVYIQPVNYSKNIPSANIPKHLLSVPSITKI
jgi:hypothetical protein